MDLMLIGHHNQRRLRSPVGGRVAGRERLPTPLVHQIAKVGCVPCYRIIRRTGRTVDSVGTSDTGSPTFPPPISRRCRHTLEHVRAEGVSASSEAGQHWRVTLPHPGSVRNANAVPAGVRQPEPPHSSGRHRGAARRCRQPWDVPANEPTSRAWASSTRSEADHDRFDAHPPVPPMRAPVHLEQRTGISPGQRPPSATARCGQDGRCDGPSGCAAPGSTRRGGERHGSPVTRTAARGRDARRVRCRDHSARCPLHLDLDDVDRHRVGGVGRFLRLAGPRSTAVLRSPIPATFHEQPRPPAWRRRASSTPAVAAAATHAALNLPGLSRGVAEVR
jgi:hypothetical protein